jgi:Hyaluronan / mRNA binding family
MNLIEQEHKLVSIWIIDIYQQYRYKLDSGYCADVGCLFLVDEEGNAPVHQGRKRTKEEEERAEADRKFREAKEAERLEDEKKMTLQQYKEMQKESKEAPKYNLRKPGEGEDKSWMKTATVVNESKKTHIEQVCAGFLVKYSVQGDILNYFLCQEIIILD